jgi:hypothetical protein
MPSQRALGALLTRAKNFDAAVCGNSHSDNQIRVIHVGHPMSKRRRKRPRASSQPTHFTATEEAFFAAGKRVHETHVEYETERPSVWRRLLDRISLPV